MSTPTGKHQTGIVNLYNHTFIHYTYQFFLLFFLTDTPRYAASTRLPGDSLLYARLLCSFYDPLNKIDNNCAN